MKKSTLSSYAQKAFQAGMDAEMDASHEKYHKERKELESLASKRYAGAEKASERINKSNLVSRENHHGLHDGRLGEHKGGASETNVYEHHRVTYHDNSGKAHDSSKAFTDRGKAEEYATKGNAIDKAGGNYKVTKVGEILD